MIKIHDRNQAILKTNFSTKYVMYDRSLLCGGGCVDSGLGTAVGPGGTVGGWQYGFWQHLLTGSWVSVQYDGKGGVLGHL